MGEYMGSKLCVASNGFSSGCPFVSGAMLGTCSDQIRASHQLSKVAHVLGITCWPTADGKAIGALKLKLSTDAPTTVLGNAGLASTGTGGTQAVGLQIGATDAVVEVRMWYSLALDASNRTQVGRIYMKTSAGVLLECGDTSLPFEAYDQRLVNSDEEGRGIGSMLVGVMAASSNITNSQPGSITAVNWLFLKSVASGGVTVSPQVRGPPCLRPAEPCAVGRMVGLLR